MHYIILRKTTLNGSVIEQDKFMGTAPDQWNATNITNILNDDVKLLQTKTLNGFHFEFYFKCYE